MLLVAAVAFAVIASCYDVDTYATTADERVRLACINSPEPVPAKAARDHLRDLVVGKKVGILGITDYRYERNVADLFVEETNVKREMVATGHAEV